MKNLIKATSFFNKENDMWVWIGTDKNGNKSYDWMHGDDYETFTKCYCKSDEALTNFIRSICRVTGSITQDNIIELIWIFQDLRYDVIEELEK